MHGPAVGGHFGQKPGLEVEGAGIALLRLVGEIQETAVGFGRGAGGRADGTH
ncbi:MAG: hypothetical protein U5J82_15665 [Desulfobacterales bacterium]|nr:hypothetical protein [Desulfobacterales bacterium]